VDPLRKSKRHPARALPRQMTRPGLCSNPRSKPARVIRSGAANFSGENIMPQSALEELANMPDPQPQSTQSQSGSALDDLINTPDPVEQGLTKNADGSFVVTPKDDESFADTMKRAAAMGKTVTPAQLQSQTQKGIKQIPTVLGAAATAGVAGPAALAAPGEIPGAVKAIQAMAAAHPVAAALVKKALYAAGAGTAYKHSKWLLDILP
jgi:hypothetical protein